MKNYKNKKCWQATTQVNLKKGFVTDQKTSKTGWLMLFIQWEDGSSTWEKILNVSFDFSNFKDT